MITTVAHFYDRLYVLVLGVLLLLISKAGALPAVWERLGRSRRALAQRKNKEVDRLLRRAAPADASEGEEEAAGLLTDEEIRCIILRGSGRAE